MSEWTDALVDTSVRLERRDERGNDAVKRTVGNGRTASNQDRTSFFIA